MREFMILPFLEFLNILFVFTIMISSYVIFRITTEIYKLSEHKGIRFFRKGFLFMAVSYVFLLLNLILAFIFSFRFMSEYKFLFVLHSLFYLIGVCFLLSSIYSKKVEDSQIYIISLAVFIIGFIFQAKLFVLIYIFLLVLFLGVVSILKYIKNRKKKFAQIYLIYIVFFSSWVLSFLANKVFVLDLISRLVSQCITAIVFLYMLYLVNKKLGNKFINKNGK